MTATEAPKCKLVLVLCVFAEDMTATEAAEMQAGSCIVRFAVYMAAAEAPKCKLVLVLCVFVVYMTA